MPDSDRTLEFWNGKYADESTPWDLGNVSPPVRKMVQTEFPDSGRVMIPGAGRGYEALYLAHRGYRVTAVDYADEAVRFLREACEREGVAIDVQQRDIFDVPPDQHEVFDILLEQTCFCAIDPRDRARYETMAHTLLKPGGRLIGVFMEVPFDDGPPYNCPLDVVRGFFPPDRWRFDSTAPVDPPEPRPGPEYYLNYTRL